MNWKHSFFEIYTMAFSGPFLLDESLRILLELREDRTFSITSALAESKRAEAKVVGAKQAIEAYKQNKEIKVNALRSESFLLETEARTLLAQPCLDMARTELAFIEHLISLIPESRLMFKADAMGQQQAQMYEYAYEYALSFAMGDRSAQLMRNILRHPLHKEILGCSELNTPQTWIDLPNHLATSLSINHSHLANSVNKFSAALDFIQPALKQYDESSVSSASRLKALCYVPESLESPDEP